MQITLNQSEVEQAVNNYVDTLINQDGDVSIHINEDGTATVLIGDEVESNDTPPVVEKQKRTRGPNKRNPAEAKHRPVEPEVKEETLTTAGGQNESSTQEAEAQGDAAVDPTDEIKEEATAKAEEAEPETATQETVVEEKAQEAVALAKPSLFANLKRN
jgi:archaellum component FlaD/FlaE